MTVFIVTYEDEYEKESCEDCNCPFTQELKGVYSSKEEAIKAIKEYITRNDAFQEDDFEIKEMEVDKKI